MEVAPRQSLYQDRRTNVTTVRWDSSRDLTPLQQENLSRIQQETLSRMFEGYYRRPQEDLNRGAWVPVVGVC